MDEVKRGNEGKSREVTGLPETEVGKDSPTLLSSYNCLRAGIVIGCLDMLDCIIYIIQSHRTRPQEKRTGRVKLVRERYVQKRYAQKR